MSVKSYAKIEGPFLTGQTPFSYVVVYKDGELHGYYAGKREVSILDALRRRLSVLGGSFDLEREVMRLPLTYYKVGVYPMAHVDEVNLHNAYPFREDSVVQEAAERMYYAPAIEKPAADNQSEI